jgi:hypothetical protein
LQPNVRPPSLLKWAVLLLGLAFACIAMLLISVDYVCNSNIEQWAPYYPDATVISVEHDFIRARGIGTSRVTLASADDAETVRQFYRDNTLALMQTEQTRGLASTHWNVEENPEGSGSIITLYSECGQ